MASSALDRLNLLLTGQPMTPAAAPAGPQPRINATPTAVPTPRLRPTISPPAAFSPDEVEPVAGGPMGRNRLLDTGRRAQPPATPAFKPDEVEPVEAPVPSDGSGIAAPAPFFEYIKEGAKGLVRGGGGMVGTTVSGVGAGYEALKGIVNDVDLNRLQLIDRLDRGQEQSPVAEQGLGADVAPGVLAIQYLRLDPTERAAIRAQMVDRVKAQTPVDLHGNPVFQAGKAIGEAARAALPAAPGWEGGVTSTLSEGLGSLGVALPLALLPGGQALAGVAFTSAGVGEAAERAAAFDEAERKSGRPGLSQEQMAKASLLGVIPGATDIIPVETLLGTLRIPTPFRKPLARAIGRIGGQAFIEGVQEGGQQFLQNLIASEYDPSQSLGDEVLPNTGAGAGVGAIAQGIAELFTRDRGRAAPPPAPPTPTPEQIVAAVPPPPGGGSTTATVNGKTATTPPPNAAAPAQPVAPATPAAPPVDPAELYAKAVELVRTQGKASTSLVQRTLGLPYAKAADLIDQMEKAGVISAAEKNGRRTVLPQGGPAAPVASSQPVAPAPKAATPAAETQPESTAKATLKAAGYTDEEIGDMDQAEAEEAVAEAARQGVQPSPDDGALGAGVAPSPGVRGTTEPDDLGKIFDDAVSDLETSAAKLPPEAAVEPAPQAEVPKNIQGGYTEDTLKQAKTDIERKIENYDAAELVEKHFPKAEGFDLGPDPDGGYTLYDAADKKVASGATPMEAVKAALATKAAFNPDEVVRVGSRGAPIKVQTGRDIEVAAGTAAPDYTPPQGEANNRQLGHVKWNGLDGSVEVAAGGKRKMLNPNTGEAVETSHTAPYGYWKGTKGADNQPVDVYWGPEPEADHPVFVLDELDPATGKFRQHKTFAGFQSEDAATEAYLGTSSKQPNMIGGITRMPVREFKEWLRHGNTSKPLTDARVQNLGGNGQPVSQSERPELPVVRAARDSGASSVGGKLRDLSGSGRPSTVAGVDVGEEKQRSRLRSGQRSVGDEKRAGEKQPPESTSSLPGQDAGAVGRGREGGPQQENAGITPAERMEPTEGVKLSARPTRQTRKALKAKTPQSLLHFLASIGGIKDYGGELKSLGVAKHFVPGVGPLVRKKGKGLDQAREAAAEAGYMDDFGYRDVMAESTVADLLELIDREARGDKVYSSREQHLVDDKKAETDRARELDLARRDIENALDDHDVPNDDPALLDRAAAILIAEPGLDPVMAFEQAVLEVAYSEEIPAEQHPAFDADIPGWTDEEIQELQSRATPESGEDGEPSRPDQGGDEFPQGREDENVGEAEGGRTEVEKGADGKDQIVSDIGKDKPADVAKRKADAPLKPKVAQRPADEGLFGDEKDQTDLVDMARQPAKKTDVAARLAELKDQLIIFASGMSRAKDMAAGSAVLGGDEGRGIGVDVGELTPAAIEQLARSVVDHRAQVFIDSGAFSTFRRNLRNQAKADAEAADLFKRENITVQGFESVDFDDVFKRYEAVEDAIAEYNAAEESVTPPLIVMPDVVGDQTASLDLVHQYRDNITTEATFRVARPVIPIQKGDLSLAQAYAEIVKILGTDDFIVGVPSNERAVSLDELKAFLTEAKPRGLHFLGAAHEKNLEPKLKAIAETGVTLEHLSADGNILRSALYGRASMEGGRSAAIGDALRPRRSEKAVRQEKEGEEREDARRQKKAKAPKKGAPTASWVIKDKATGAVVMETFDKKKVDALNTEKYEAMPIGEYLAGLNRPAPTAGQSAKAAVKNVGMGLGDVAAGLGKLFGGKDRLGAGPNFDEDTYRQALPLFKAGVAHFAEAGRNLADMIRALVKYLSTDAGLPPDAIRDMKPYVMRFADDVRSGKESLDAPSGDGALEPTSGDADVGDGLGSGDIPPAGGPDGQGARAGVGTSTRGGGRSGRGGGASGGRTSVVGKDGNLEIPRDPAEPGERDAPAGGREPGTRDGEQGPPPEYDAAEETRRTVAASASLDQRRKAQREAEKIGADVGGNTANKENVAATLPMLFPEQQDDVYRAELRYQKPDGHGMLFTNGTGTGKTFSGLGVVKRFAKRGKGNILILAPSQDILADWVRSAKDLVLDISVLESTQDAGKGIVATTYANFGANPTLADRKWDLVVADEAHKLSQNAEGQTTEALRTFRAITQHPDGITRRAEMTFRKEYAAYTEAVAINRAMPTAAAQDKVDAAWEAYNSKAEPAMERWRAEPRVAKALMMSATPFAHHFSLDSAEGYLFEHPKEDPKTVGAYNAPSGRDLFYIQHFGYRIRYNKLTKPEADVNSEVMEREFHEYLRKEGSLWGRALEVERDYDRKFVLIHDAIGADIDKAMKSLMEDDDGKFRAFWDMVSKKFDYLTRMRLLEAIKARGAIDYIKKQQALGRKVVVFHDFNEGGGINPFDLRFGPDDTIQVYVGGKYEQIPAAPLWDEWLARNPYVKDMKFASYRAPIAELSAAFPNALIYNGTVPQKKRTEAKRLFNEKGSGANLIIVQSAAGEAGISLHDTWGAPGEQRLLLNLGMPARPTTAIQEEGRIYRVGQQSDAIFRYLNTGTNWERWTFAGRISERSGTVENLALGNAARRLRMAFVDAFNESDEHEPNRMEGKGGKAADRADANAISEFERAKTHYYGQQKNKKRRDQREGIDYFATPEPLGFKMVEWANLKPNERFLEPSAGHGAIVRYAPEGTHRTLVEPSSELASKAALYAPGARAIVDRFENLHITNKYDGIVMNPPFGVGGKTAIEHVAKAMRHLANGGRIVALIPKGQAEQRLEKLMESEESKGIYVVARIDLPTVTFERAGTAINATIVVLEKQTDREVANKLQEVGRDVSNAETVKELFERIENMGVPDRLEPITKDAIALDDTTVTLGGTKLELAKVAGKDKTVFVARLGENIPKSRYAQLAKATEAAGGTASGRAFIFNTDEARQQFLAAAAAPPPAPTPAAPGAAIKFTLGETIHAKTGGKLYVATFTDRVDRDVYDRVKSIATRNDGWYSSFKGNGAIPGFQFKSAEARGAFLAEVNPPPTGGGVAMAAAWHGSRVPDIDAFSVDYIGTGEGFQTYGWGLYFAGKRQVAEYYRAKLAGLPSIRVKGGIEDYMWSSSVSNADNNRLLKDWADANLDLPPYDRQFAGYAVREVLQQARDKAWEGKADPLETVAALADEAAKNIGGRLDHHQVGDRIRRALVARQIRAKGLVEVDRPGGLYEVQIPESADLLQWEVPYKEQSDHVKASVERLWAEYNLGWQPDGTSNPVPPEMTGETLYRFLGDQLSEPSRLAALSKNVGLPSHVAYQNIYRAPLSRVDRSLAGARASLALKAAGIPGTQYLDQGSRNPLGFQQAMDALSKWEERLKEDPTNDYVKNEVADRRAELARIAPTYNYVIFDDATVKTVQRHAMAAAVEEGAQLLLNLEGTALPAEAPVETGPDGLRVTLSFFAETGEKVEGEGTLYQRSRPGSVIPENYVIFRDREIPFRQIGQLQRIGEAREDIEPYGVTRASTGERGVVRDRVTYWGETLEGKPVFMRALDGAPVTAPRRSPDELAALDRVKNDLQAIASRMTGTTVILSYRDQIPLREVVSPAYMDAMTQAAAAAGKTIMPGAGGVWRPNPRMPMETLITIALRDPVFDPYIAIHHELWHQFEFALASEAERELIRREMPRLRALAAMESPFADAEMVKTMPETEIAAIAFQRYARLRMAGEVTGGYHIGLRRLYDRLLAILRTVRNYFTRRGITTYEELFGQVYDGAMANRAPYTGGEENAAMAAAAPPPTPPAAPPGGQPPAVVPPTPPPSLPRQRTTNTLTRRVGEAADAFRVKVQDRELMIRRAEEEIERQTGVRMPENLSTYMAAGLFPGRAGERMADLKRDVVDPLIRDMQAAGVTLSQMGDFLYARHHAERKAEMLRINPNVDMALPENESFGSGMTDAEALAIMQRIHQAGQMQAYARLANRVDAMITETRETMVRAGLLSREMADEWANKYPHYVPLRGFEAEPEGDERPRIGKGFSVSGPESLAALGRRSKADNPLVYAVMQAEQAIVRAEKNRVDRTFLRFVQAFPDPARWRIFRAEMKRRINPTTGMVETYAVRPPFVKDRDLLGVKIGGKTTWIEIRDPQIARAMTKAGMIDHYGPVMSKVMGLTRTYARMLTAWNPEFSLWSNPMRDLTTALVNVSDIKNKPAGVRRQIVKDALGLKSVRGILKALRDPQASGEYSTWFEEYRAAGGKISWYSLDDIDTIRKKIENAMKAGRVRQGIAATGKLIEDLNTAVENGVRLSVYIALRRAGVSQNRAAFIARELTVNFNRKGEWGPAINALYMFFNASIQGLVRVAQAATRSRVARVAIASMFGTGFALSWLNYMLAGDDDNGDSYYDAIPSYIKERNLVVMFPGGKGQRLTIPLPYIYNLPFFAGDRLATVLRGNEAPAAAAMQVGSAMISAMNPLGMSSLWQMVTPTMADPFVQVAENQTWFGTPVQPTKFDRKKPDAENYFASAPDWAKGMARWLNENTGGNVGRSGWVDVSPETLQHFQEFLLAGLPTMAIRGGVMVQNLMQGEEWLPEETPFIRRVYGKETAANRRAGFYDLWDDVDAARYEVRQLRKAGKDEDEAGRADVAQRYFDEADAAEAKNAAELEVWKQFDDVRKALTDFADRRRALDGVTGPAHDQQLEELNKEEAEVIRAAIAELKARRREQRK